MLDSWACFNPNVWQSNSDLDGCSLLICLFNIAMEAVAHRNRWFSQLQELPLIVDFHRCSMVFIDVPWFSMAMRDDQMVTLQIIHSPCWLSPQDPSRSFPAPASISRPRPSWSRCASMTRKCRRWSAFLCRGRWQRTADGKFDHSYGKWPSIYREFSH